MNDLSKWDVTKPTAEVAGHAEIALLDCRPQHDYIRALDNIDTEDELMSLLTEYRGGLGKVAARQEWLETQIEKMRDELSEIQHDHPCMTDVESRIIFAIGKIRVGEQAI